MNSQNYRRTWNRSDFQLKALEREQNTNNGKANVHKTKTIKLKVDLKPKCNIGSFKIGRNKNFFCAVCDSYSNDSLSYLNHMNSKFHHKNLGTIMKTESCTLSQVKERFLKAKSKKNHPEVEEKLEIAKKESSSMKIENPETLKMNLLMGFSSFGKK